MFLASIPLVMLGLLFKARSRFTSINFKSKPFTSFSLASVLIANLTNVSVCFFAIINCFSKDKIKFLIKMYFYSKTFTYICKTKLKDMTKREFTRECAHKVKGIIGYAAGLAYNQGKHDTFVQELIEQDSDEGSRSGTKRVLGEDLYNELQKFKTEK